eukprot:2429059-Rhodomonas_salina.1
MAPRRNTVNPAGATSNATTEGQVAMDTPNVPPGIAQVAMDNSATPNPTANPTPPISQDAMAAPTIGIPPCLLYTSPSPRDRG